MPMLQRSNERAAGITRSVFIRALIQAAKTKGLEVAGATGEADLAERISHALNRRGEEDT
jgi:hypothetical protein